MPNLVTTPLTLRSARAYIAAHPGCAINDISEAHGLSFETVTPNGWQCTATDHGAWS